MRHPLTGDKFMKHPDLTLYLIQFLDASHFLFDFLRKFWYNII